MQNHEAWNLVSRVHLEQIVQNLEINFLKLDHSDNTEAKVTCQNVLLLT